MGAGSALRSGHVWTSRTLTWSDPQRGNDYGWSYRSDVDRDGRDAPFDNFLPLSDRQVTTVRFALDATGGPAARIGFSVEGFTGLKVRYMAGAASADIRVANSDDVSTAYAYHPGSGVGGDVWLGGSGRNPRAGNYDHVTLIHELGHALGLDHPHEGGRNGAVPRSLDSLEFTVMTYRPWIGGPATGARYAEWSAPQTWMMLDIAALQENYGANYDVNCGATVYKWKPGSGNTWVNGEVAISPGGRVIFATIWDGGGCDRYDLSAYSSDLRVDLRPGKYSVFEKAQLADLGGGPNGGHARGSIFNALMHEGDQRSLIEQATGGSGNDRLIGNGAENRLHGGAGDDRLSGMSGADTLIGGRGHDAFVFATLASSHPGARDQIVAGGAAPAFEAPGPGQGDIIDLRGIDANVHRAGDQAFVFGAASGPGRLWLVDVDGVTIVRGSVDRDAAPEFELAIVDGPVRAADYTAHDFLL